MKTKHLLTSFALAAALLLAPAFSTSAAPKKGVGSSVSMTPSVVGGAPIQVAAYNFTNVTATGYYVDPNGVLQSLPGASSVPPTGTTPIMVNSFRNATLFLQRPRGGGVWKHFGGNSANPIIVLGNPPSGWQAPGKKGGNSAAEPGGEVPDGVIAGPGTKGRKTVNVTNVTTTNTITRPSTTPTAPSTPTASTEPAKSKTKSLRTTKDPQVAEFLRIHNAARHDVGVTALEWSNDLANAAQEWADQLARSGKFEHQPESPYGENLGMGTGNYSPASAANSWLSEKAAYSPSATVGKGKGKKGAKTDINTQALHYTQMVWSKTTMVGYGVATTADGKTIVVAKYNPRGNVIGEKPYGE